MNNNESQNLNSVVPPTTASGVGPNPQVPPVPENGVPTVPPVAPAMPQAPEAPQPIPNAPVEPVNVAPVNLQPEGTVPPVVETPMPTVAEPLMGTPLNAQTVLNSGGPVSSMEAMSSGQSGVGQIPPMGPAPQSGMGPVPPMPNGAMMGGIPTPPTMPTGGEEKPKKKMNPLIIVLVVVLVAAVGFGVYYFINQSQAKSPKSTVTITPLLKELELGQNIDVTLPYMFATVSAPIDINSCEVSTDLDSNKVGTYQYTVTCGQYKLENQTVTVSDTTAPVVKLKTLAILPSSELKLEDFVDFVDEASEYSFMMQDEVDTSVEGTYEVPFTVEDDYGNKTEVTGELVISADAPEYYMNCYEVRLSSEKYKDAVVSNTYRFGINSLGEYYNVYKNRYYRFETVESFEAAAEDATENSFDGYQGNVRVNSENSAISVSYPVDGDDLKEEYDVDEFPTYDMDIEDFFADKGFTCEPEE